MEAGMREFAESGGGVAESNGQRAGRPMKRGGPARLPGLIFIVAVVCGGWFLQSDVGSSSNMYIHARVFDEVVRHIERDFVEEVDIDALREAAINGMVERLADPNSRFLPARDWEEERIRTQGDYAGVGLEVIPRDGFITVSAPIPATPAARAGMKPGDRIVEVDGRSVEGWATEQAVDLLRGEPGTSVRIGVRRPGGDRLIIFDVVRAVIQVPSVPFATMLEGGIGYLPLLIFNRTTTREVRAAIDSLTAEGMTSLILDLRGNRGGLLSEGVALTDLFLDPGKPIVEIRSRTEVSEAFVAGREQAYPELPVVVLVEWSSASASEIVAGALQDHDRALLIGATTFGKGSVQSLFPLAGGSALRLTTGRWYTPAGRSIQRDMDARLAGGGRGADTARADATERPEADRPGIGDRPRFRSAGGRIIHGGGGIVPDLRLAQDTLSSIEQEAMNEMRASAGGFSATLRRWAVNYVNARPDLRPGFEITDADLESFHAEFREGGADIPLETLLRARGALTFLLGSQIALVAWDDLGHFRRTRLTDTQLARAVELLLATETQAELFALAGTPLGAVATTDAGPAAGDGPR